MTMRSVIRDLARRHRATSGLLALRALSASSHLRSSGWFDSYFRSMPVDGQGQPIPWYTYAAIRFLEPRLDQRMSVFEYGSGNSTLWWSERVAHVTACEHDKAWHDLMRAQLPSSVSYIHADLSDGARYAEQVNEQDRSFDIVVIDGRDRVRCARHSLDALAPDGAIVWDNSDRAEYQEGYDFLVSRGFRRLDFWGMGPINSYEWCTSVFYRSANCLGL